MAWSAVLLALSGQAGSGSLTSQILGWLLPASSPAFDAGHFALRKSLHVLAYGLLGFLNFRAVRGPRSGWNLRWSLIAVTLAVFIASLDEWHQTFVPGRTGVVSDVAIDCMGATLAQVLVRVTGNR
jgi:VanZ family protein